MLQASSGVKIYVKTEYPYKIININTLFETIVITETLKHIELNMCNNIKEYLSNQYGFTQMDLGKHV